MPKKDTWCQPLASTRPLLTHNHVCPHTYMNMKNPPPTTVHGARGRISEVSPGSHMYPHPCVHPMIMYTYTPPNKHPFLLDHSSYRNTKQATMNLWVLDCESWSDITAPNVQPSIFLHTLLWAVFPLTPASTASRLSTGPSQRRRSSSGVPRSTYNFLREASWHRYYYPHSLECLL